MWCLRGREGFCVYILPNQKKSFGKSLADIKLEGDVTVSRLHAVVSLEPTEDPETQYKCVINDVSKYGTFVTRDKKKEKLLTDVKFILKAGDIIQFGLKESSFVLLYHSFVIATSSLDKEDIMKLKDIVSHLEAKLPETWENFCTHLTVAKNTLFTTKLACALASAKPIVTNAYWDAVDVAIKQSKELPEIEDFLPKLKEQWLKVCSRLFLPNEKRKILFKGLSFVHFCTKQYFAYAPLITAAGGKSCVYPTKRPLTPRDLTAKNAIVIQQPNNDSLQLTQAIATDYPIIYHKLQADKRRMVSDTEILLAILYCTTEMYCNPKYDFATFLKLETPTFFSLDMLIEDTQNIINTDTRQTKRKIIPETYESQNKTVPKKIHYDENIKKLIFDINKSNITMTQNSDNEKFKCKIIPETCYSQTNNKISENYLFYGNELECISDTNESNIVTKNMQVVDNEEMKHKIIDKKIYDYQNNENISKKTYLFNESERCVPDRSSIPVKIRNKNIKNNYFSNKSELKNISDSNNSNIMTNIFSSNTNKQFKIIPDGYFLEKNISNIFSHENEQVQIFETCGFNEEFINNFAMEKEQNVKLQKREIVEKYNVTFTKNDQEESMLQENEYRFLQENMIIDRKNVIFKKNLNREENLIVRKDNFNKSSSKFSITRWENSKSTKTSLESAKEIKENDNGIYLKEKKNDLFEKNSSRFRLQSSLEEQKLSLIYNSVKNQENNKVKRNQVQTKNNKKEEIQKTEDNSYEKYLNQNFTDDILRKDVSCGKKFIKMFVMRPERILRSDDFVL